VTDATILIPTFRHPTLVPYALRSALAQEGAEVDVLVVGDGVQDDTRVALEPFLADRRVTFFDNPKGERHGERHRHEALQYASGRIVCYLSDDDLLLGDHVAEMGRLLENADFAHSAPFVVEHDESLAFAAIDLSQRRFWPFLAEGRWNKIVLTGAAHTLDAYHRLPYGWRPAPPDVWTDLHMWRQFLQLPGLRALTGTRITALHLPDQDRQGLSAAERAQELESWWTRMQAPGFRQRLEEIAADEVRRTAVRHELRIQELKATLRAIQSTRLWRARTTLASLRLRRMRGGSRRAVR
jgi:glycosyltransferase involved in cell wall biosynthesis